MRNLRTYRLLSQCTRSPGDIVPSWRSDATIKPNSVEEGESLFGVRVVDAVTAAEALAGVLAQHELGPHGKARGVRRDGEIPGREGGFFVSHIWCQTKKVYRGTDVRFAVLVD